MAQVAALLLRCAATAPQTGLLEQELRALAARALVPVARIAAHAWESGTHPGPQLYAYLWLAQPREISAAQAANPANLLPGFDGHLQGVPAELCALERLDQRIAASAGSEACAHYVVETDVAPGHEAEVYAWYDEEHMAGLAAVPGTVRAQRLANLTAAPRIYACYDLVSAEVRETPPWLAVRATDWASRARPHFRNTRRGTFATLFDITL